MGLTNITKRNKIIIAAVLVVLAVIGYYLAVYQSFAYQSNNNTIGNGIISFSIIAIQMLWLNISDDSKWRKFLSFSAVVVSLIVIFVITFNQQEQYLEEELQNYGVNSIGTVIGFEVETHRRSPDTQYATFNYRFENKVLIQRVENYDNEYSLNQKLNLKISKRHPEMFKIMIDSEE
jgi:cell division protein FtsL